MEKGKVLIQFKSGAENDNADELPNFEDSDYEIEVEGSEALIYELEPGEYDVNVSVEEQATKTIWTDGEYNYAITAYGAGGDDDYGLQADDLAIMVKAIK